MAANKNTGRMVAISVLVAAAILAIVAAVTPTEAQALPALAPITDRGSYALSDAEWDELWNIQQRCYEVTAGQRTSTTFDIDAPRLLGKNEWTVDDYGYEPVEMWCGKMDIATRFDNQVDAEIAIHCHRILNVLRNEKPSIMAWQDQYSYPYVEIEWNKEQRDGKWFVSIASAKVSCDVTADCSDGVWQVSPSSIELVRRCVDRAQGIVNRHNGETPRRKVQSYCDEIYDLTSFDHSAPHGGIYYTTNHPWTFTSVFDDNPATLTVCEGYAKAYKLLFELAGDDSVKCHVLLGYDASSKGREKHTWCSIQMPDGKNYLADITNNQPCAIGSGKLLVVPASGSVEGGYSVNCGKGGTVNYAYGDDTLDIYQYGALVISDTPYAEPIQVVEEPVQPEETTAKPEQENEKDLVANPATVAVEQPHMEVPEAVGERQEQLVIESPDNTRYITFDFDESEEPKGAGTQWVRLVLVALAAIDAIAGIATVSIVAASHRKRRMRYYTRYIAATS